MRMRLHEVQQPGGLLLAHARMVGAPDGEGGDVLLGPVEVREPHEHLVEVVQHRLGVAALGEPRARRAAVGVEGGEPHADRVEGRDHRSPAGGDHAVQRGLTHRPPHHVPGLGRHPHALGELLALEREQDRAPGHAGVLGQHLALEGSGAEAVGRRVDGEQAAERAGVVVQGGREQVERVPAVGAVDRLEVRHVAVGEHLVAHPLVRDEPQVTPDVGLGQLLLQHLDGEPGPLEVGELGPRGRHHHQPVAATDTDRRLREARQRGRPLREHPEGGPGGGVRPGLRDVAAARPRLRHSVPRPCVDPPDRDACRPPQHSDLGHVAAANLSSSP